MVLHELRVLMCVMDKVKHREVVAAVPNLAGTAGDIRLASDSHSDNLHQELMIVNDIMSAIVLANCESILQHSFSTTRQM